MSAPATTAPPPTPRQAEILAFIAAYERDRGWAPTVRELGEGLGIGSPNGVMCHLHLLRKKGLLTWERNRSRTLRLLHADPPGWVAARDRLPARSGPYVVVYRPTAGGPGPQALLASFEAGKGWRGLPFGQRQAGVLYWCVPPAGVAREG